MQSYEPSPSDPYNAGSVRLAARTKIRLYLPGLASTSASHAQEGNDSAYRTTRQLQAATSNHGNKAGQSQESTAVFEQTDDGTNTMTDVRNLDTAQDAALIRRQKSGMYKAAQAGVRDNMGSGKGPPRSSKGHVKVAPSGASYSNANGSLTGAASPTVTIKGPPALVPTVISSAATSSRVPIWERSLATPKGSQVRDRQAIDSAAGLRVVRPVVAKTFSIGMPEPMPAATTKPLYPDMVPGNKLASEGYTGRVARKPPVTSSHARDALGFGLTVSSAPTSPAILPGQTESADSVELQQQQQQQILISKSTSSSNGKLLHTHRGNLQARSNHVTSFGAVASRVGCRPNSTGIRRIDSGTRNMT